MLGNIIPHHRCDYHPKALGRKAECCTSGWVLVYVGVTEIAVLGILTAWHNQRSFVP